MRNPSRALNIFKYFDYRSIHKYVLTKIVFVNNVSHKRLLNGRKHRDEHIYGIDTDVMNVFFLRIVCKIFVYS